MNKLGFAIKLASQGAGNAIECNKGQWTSKVVDIREYLKLFNGLQGTDNIVTFMSFDEGGCFLTQLRAISGRMGDFLSGWIYIPNTIEASGDDIMNAYNYVRNILSQSNLTDLKDDIASFFSKEFPSKEVAAQYSASKGQLYGVRFLGHYTLKEIVGEHRYQPYYSDYKAVFLLNKDEEVVITKEAANNFRNLTDKDIVKTSTLVPPTYPQLQALGLGTKIYTIDGSDFNQPLLVNLGSKVPLLLSRDGFENMKLEVPVSSERQLIDFSSIKILWRKKISASMFSVRNRKNEKIEKGVRIFVNGTDVTFQEVLFTEEECRQAIVKVTAPDYETFEQRRSLLIEDKQIILNRKIRSFQAKVELTNGSHAEMTIESKNLPSSHESPLKGYTYDEDYHGDKILKMDSWFIWKQRLWGFLAAFVTVMLIVAFAAFDSWLDTHHFKVGLPPWEKDRPTQQYTNSYKEEMDDVTQDQNNTGDNSDVQNSEELSLNEAIQYLDNNTTWSKAELNKYPDLQGLFDDMNAFNLSRLLNEWHSKLASSQNFQKVCESANKTLSHGWNPKQGSHNPTYNKPDDEQISLTNYINWLDQDQTPKPSSEGGFHPNVNSKGGTNVNKAGASTGKPKASSAKSGNGKGETTKNGGL
ncbi:MAG: hypothetical protein J5965_17205 [Aeriscardovia sp.]|jgi:hypothetical protein|nr:hypothetical protein [Aeriscardovia sp.]